MSPGPNPSSTEIISTALSEYTKLIEKDLVKDPLAIKIQRCDSTSAICRVLEQHAGALHDGPRLMACQNAIVDNLRNLSSIPALSEVASIRDVSLRDNILLCPVMALMPYDAFIFYLGIATCTTRLFCAHYPSF